jgi:hypothetical protein
VADTKLPRGSTAKGHGCNADCATIGLVNGDVRTGQPPRARRPLLPRFERSVAWSIRVALRCVVSVPLTWSLADLVILRATKLDTETATNLTYPKPKRRRGCNGAGRNIRLVIGGSGKADTAPPASWTSTLWLARQRPELQGRCLHVPRHHRPSCAQAPSDCAEGLPRLYGSDPSGTPVAPVAGSRSRSSWVGNNETAMAGPPACVSGQPIPPRHAGGAPHTKAGPEIHVDPTAQNGPTVERKRVGRQHEARR